MEEEKTNIVEENKKNVEEKQKKQETQVKWVIAISVLLIVGVFIAGWISLESKKFDYVGVQWQKEMFGEIPIYTTLITGYGVNGLPMNFKLALRNNPKELDIPLEGDIKFIRNKPVYFSLNMSSGIDKCGSIALISFGQFMSGLGFNLVTAISSQELAEEYKRPFINCKNKPGKTVIVLTTGNQSKIEQVEKNCYVLSVNDCEIIKVMEKFEVATLASLNKRPL
jgi:hypothetical protein